MASPIARYAFINAKLRARLSQLVPEDTVSALTRAPSLIEAMQILKGTAFADAETVYTQSGDLALAELRLLEREVALFADVSRHLEGPPLAFVEALAARFEVENVKNVLRLWFDRVVRGRDVRARAGYLLRLPLKSAIDVDALLGAPDLDVFIRLLERTPYAAIVRSASASILAERSLFRAEVELDKHYYRDLLDTTALLDPRDAAIARRLVGVEIDMANIGWIVRLKTFYDLPVDRALDAVIPSGWSVDQASVRAAYATQNVKQILDQVLSSGYAPLKSVLSAEGGDASSRLALVERVLSEIVLYEVRHALGGYPFSIGIVLAYFVLKQSEIRRIVTILNAKYYDAEEERIAGML